MPQHVTKSGLNRMVATTLSESDRDEMEHLLRILGWSVGRFVKRSVQMMIAEQKTNEVLNAVEKLQQKGVLGMTVRCVCGERVNIDRDEESVICPACDRIVENPLNLPKNSTP